MATFVLIPGAGSGAWYWHFVEARLREFGHRTIPVDLPNGDDSAGLAEYTDAVVAAIGDPSKGMAPDDIILVAHSMGAFTAPLVTERIQARMIILVAAMVPAPGESPGEWWANTRHGDVAAEQKSLHGWDIFTDGETIFAHDVPPALAAEALEHSREQSGTPFAKPWPMEAWPSVPTRVLIGTNDRFFPAAFQRRVTQERLGITPDETDSGHLPMLAKPVELADHLMAYAAEVR